MTAIPVLKQPRLNSRFWDDVRADFPVLHQHVGDKPLIYLDNAATTHKPSAVIDVLTRFYQQDNSNVHRGLHALSMRCMWASSERR